jgi:hypothetical protein
MALTQGAWTTGKTINERVVWYCDVVQTTAEEYSATLKTPKDLDTTKSFTLLVNTEGATLDGTTLPVDIYGGYSENFALSVTTSTLTVTDGFLLNPDVIADVSSAIGAVIVDPNLNIADDADDLVRGQAVPYYGFVLDGASTLTAGTCRFMIIQ